MCVRITRAFVSVFFYEFFFACASFTGSSGSGSKNVQLTKTDEGPTTVVKIIGGGGDHARGGRE